jgi:hypothetical protein
MQSIRESVHILAQAHEFAVHRWRCVVPCIWLGGFDPGCVDGETCKPLRHIIVQFAGEPTPLVQYSSQENSDAAFIRP